MAVTRSPSCLKRRWPAGKRSTKSAKTSCRPTPQPTTRQLMARRLRDSAMPIPRMGAILPRETALRVGEEILVGEGDPVHQPAVGIEGHDHAPIEIALKGVVGER